MSRLNKATREYITAKALEKSGIPALELQLDKDYASWVERLRVQTNAMSDTQLGKIQAAYKELVAQIPDGLFQGHSLLNQRREVWPNLGGLRIGCVQLKDRTYAVHSPTVTTDDPLTAEWHALEDRRKELQGRRTVLTAQITSLIESVTTIPKLLQAWPEAKELLPPNEQPVVTNVPAMLISSLNAVIGLPTEEAACA